MTPNSKGSELYFSIEDLDTILPDGNVVADYWPALQPVKDDEGNIIGAEPSDDLTLYNRIKYNWLSDRPFKLADQASCDLMINTKYHYTGDNPDLQGREYHKIRVVIDEISTWVLTIEAMKQQISQQTGEVFAWPHAELLGGLFWSENFEPVEEI